MGELKKIYHMNLAGVSSLKSGKSIKGDKARHKEVAKGKQPDKGKKPGGPGNLPGLPGGNKPKGKP
jgi:hypothetical protein